MKTVKQYTARDQKYICSKIPQIPWPQISETLRSFWIEWRDTNEKQ